MHWCGQVGRKGGFPGDRLSRDEAIKVLKFDRIYRMNRMECSGRRHDQKVRHCFCHQSLFSIL